MDTLRIDTEGVRGVWCPACGEPSRLRRERRTRNLDTSDVLAGVLLGWAGMLFVMVGRTQVRLRCGQCECRFPEPVGMWRAMAWLVVVASGLSLLTFVIVAPEAGRAAALLAAAVVAMLHGAVGIAVWQRVGRRWRSWRRRVEGRDVGKEVGGARHTSVA